METTPRKYAWYVWMTLMLIAACDDSEQKTEPKGNLTQDTDTNADAISGATPGVKQMALSQKHEGWNKMNCLSCHDTPHVHNYNIGDCVSCHGKNSNITRPVPHDDGKCLSCHEDSHRDMGELQTDSCRGCHGFTTVKQDTCAYKEDYDVAIIGGGGGGLAAAASLTALGKSVVLVEQHYKIGGCMVAFNRGDYRFEATLHAFDGYGLPLLGALGISDKVTPVIGDVMYQVVTPEFTFDVSAEKSEYRDALKIVFPDEADHIDDLFKNFGIAGDYQGMTLVEAVESHGITDRTLINLFTVLAPFLATTRDQIMASDFVGMWDSYHTVGYYYFEGGSQSITDALESTIIENGGTIKRHTRAAQITVEENRATGIRTADGGCYRTDAVISDANAKTTFIDLVGEEYLPKSLIEGMEKKSPSPSNLAMIFLGVDHDYTDLFPGRGHEIFVVPSSQDEFGIDEMRCLPETAGYTISNYSVLDPMAAPDGKNTIVITVDYMDYDCNNVWQFDESYADYTAYKTTMAEVIIARAEAILPELSQHIEILEVASPKTIGQYLLSPKGAWAGWALGEEQVEYLESTQTPVDGLFMAGSWVVGSGESVALSSGIGAAGAANAFIKESNQ